MQWTQIIGWVALCASFWPTTLRADPPFTFTRIIDNNTVIPDSGGGTFKILGAAAQSGSRIAFEGAGSAVTGLYEWNNGILVRVADSSTPVPSASGTFAAVGIARDNDGERIVFGGNNGNLGGLYQRFEGVLSRIADEQMTAPNGGNYYTMGTPSAEGNSISFSGRHYIGLNDFPAVYRWDNGAITTVADTTSPVPGGTGTFQELTSNSVRLDNGATWFRGRDAAGKSGIYRRDVNGLQAIIDSNSEGPAGEGKFLGAGLFGVDGQDLLFNAGTVGNPVPALYSRINGEVTRLLNYGDPAPGGGIFGTLAQFSLENGVAVFLDNDNSVLYTNLGGNIQRIIGSGSTLDGKTVSQIHFVSNGRDGLNLAFGVTFTDHAPPVAYSQAIYTMTLPGPGALLPFGAAALFAARRSR